MDLTGPLNHMFLEWLEEWQREATQKQLRIASSINRAADVLKACPIEFKHPNELLDLKYFGPSIVGVLQRRLQEYCTAYGYKLPGK